MDIIYEAAAKYVVLEQYEYEFVLSQNRRKKIVKVNFKNEDFFHLAGLQYLQDVNVPRNRKKTLDYILFENKITDTLLQKSKIYQNKIPDKDIKSRIEQLRFLEQYLDTDNIIRIFTTRNNRGMSSMINADYIIESQIKGSVDVVYIFLKHRKEEPDYCGIVSFFKKDTSLYGGDILYWMLKKKIQGRREMVLYQHEKYNEFIEK